jgi:hypothetical protein
MPLVFYFKKLNGIHKIFLGRYFLQKNEKNEKNDILRNFLLIYIILINILKNKMLVYCISLYTEMATSNMDEITKMGEMMTSMGITDPQSLLQMMLKTQTLKTQQEKKKVKSDEKIKKEKEKLRPIKDLKKYFKSLNQAEKVFDISERVKNQQVRSKIYSWLYNGLEPYNSFLTGEKGKACFKNNAIGLIKLIQRIQGFNNFGVICSCNQRSRERYFIKTEYGILTGRKAKSYLVYLLERVCLQSIKQVAGQKMTELGEKGGIDDCFAQMSFFQLFSMTSIDTMVKYIVNESYDKDFAKTFQSASRLRNIKEFLGEIPDEFKEKMVTSNVACDFNFSDTDFSSDSDSDSDSSDSDSD